MLQEDSRRIRLLELNEASVDLEFNEKYAILHLPIVRKFGNGEFKKCKEYIEDLYSFFQVSKLEGPYAASDDPKIQKLALKLGFEYLGESNKLKVFKYAPSTSSSRSSSTSSWRSPS